MARSENPAILSQLQNARTLPEQAAALRALKNEVVGHMPKKALWIVLGVLEPIIRSLASARSPVQLNGKDARLPVVQRPLSDEENVRLQALQLVASFANGGPPFMPPLNAAGVLPAVFANISPFSNPPQIVAAALRALLELLKAAALLPSNSPIGTEVLTDNLFAPQHIESLCAILSNSSSNPVLQIQVSSTAELICKLCRQDHHQHLLATSGVLDALASRLASFAVARGHVVPGADAVAQNDGLFEAFPDPAPQGAQLGHILQAIAAILGDSKYRAYRLTSSPAILAAFPSIKFEPAGGTPDSQQDSDSGDFSGVRQPSFTAMEYILPSVHANMPRKSTPPTPTPRIGLSESRSSSRSSLNKKTSSVWKSPHHQSPHSGVGNDSEDVESPLIPWLVLLVRSFDEQERIGAAAVLSSLVKAGLGGKGSRETSIGFLVAPVLVSLIARTYMDVEGKDWEDFDTLRACWETGPAVLARLLLDSDCVQKAAFDCSAIKVLSSIMRASFRPVEEIRGRPYWYPPDDMLNYGGNNPAAKIGELGGNPVILHNIKVRESSLKAIAALAAGKEDYRKAFLEEETMPFVMESLTRYPRKARSAKERATDKTANEPRTRPTRPFGINPLSVVIAGCQVVRMMSRSISILRTTLVDYGVATPLFLLLKHPNVNVQIAATAAMCNFVVEVSPVRELLTQQGVMKVLCEHAHSHNPALRLNALWALKHFVDGIETDAKKACLEELESGWLVQLICEDTEDSALQMGRSRESSGVDMDDDTDMHSSEETHRWLYGSKGLLRELDSSQSIKLRQTEDKLNAVRDAELNPVRRARNDDLAIQEQGLTFIRNLIGRPGVGSESDTTEMIDYLFREIGQDRLFDIMTNKLRPKVLQPFAQRRSISGRDKPVLHPQAKIITAVIYILAHISASIPQHRQMVIAQNDLLKLLVQQANSKDREVRVALCYLIINLTSLEDDGEVQSRVQRVQVLKQLNFHTKMETLKHHDPELDVREQAKIAAWQIQHGSP